MRPACYNLGAGDRASLDWEIRVAPRCKAGDIAPYGLKSAPDLDRRNREEVRQQDRIAAAT